MPLPSTVVIEVDPARIEREALAAVKAYWNEKRATRAMPGRGDIVPAELKRWLPQVLLVDVQPGGADFRYRLLGSRLLPYFPGAAVGQLMSHALAPFGAETASGTLQVYGLVAQKGVPIFIKGPGELFAQRSKFFEAILMPLADNDERVNMIFGAFEFDWQLERR